MYWSITGGAQQDLFFIDPDSGALSFKTVDTNGDAIELPSYVSHSDENYDPATSNRFEVTIQASDSTDPAEAHIGDLTLTVMLQLGWCCAVHPDFNQAHLLWMKERRVYADDCKLSIHQMTLQQRTLEHWRSR